LTELHSNVDCHFSTARIFKAAPVPCRGRLRLSTSSLLDICPSQCVTLSGLLLPALDFGTVYLLTSGLPRHS